MVKAKVSEVQLEEASMHRPLVGIEGGGNGCGAAQLGGSEKQELFATMEGVVRGIVN